MPRRKAASSDGVDLFGGDNTSTVRESRRKTVPAAPPPEPPRRPRKKDVEAAENQSGFTVGDFDYIHAFICPGTRHPYVVQQPGLQQPVHCRVCNAEMRRHFFSKRKKSS